MYRRHKCYNCQDLTECNLGLTPSSPPPSPRPMQCAVHPSSQIFQLYVPVSKSGGCTCRKDQEELGEGGVRLTADAIQFIVTNRKLILLFGEPFGWEFMQLQPLRFFFFFIDERLVTLHLRCFCVCQTLSGSRIRTLLNFHLFKFRIQA